MGAGCSTGSAAKVQDSVKPAAGRTAVGDITELSKEAQEQLKVLQSQNPDTLSAVGKYAAATFLFSLHLWHKCNLFEHQYRSRKAQKIDESRSGGEGR